MKQPADTDTRLSQAIQQVRERVTACRVCGTLTDADPCAICTDPRRDAGLVCVAEEASDVTAIERAGRFRGRYHALRGRLSPLESVGAEALPIVGFTTPVSHAGGGERGGARPPRSA